jgi:PAS domain S-box-containing protein
MKSQEQIKKRLFEKTEVDVFNSEHGTIYIDLIEERGKIMKITRNVCDMFGYPKSEMVEMNIDGYMPSIFARSHDKFLLNFIERGEITLLKEKQRVVFGKNKKHFIFPFNIRLKVENMNEGAFGACALITKLKTNKEYILYSKKGCIDEMSEGIYQRIFQPLLQGDVSRISRLNIMKMMPALNMSIEMTEKQQTQLNEGVILFPMEFDELIKFRYHRRVENEGNSDISSDKFDRMSFNGTNQMSLDSRKG